MSTYKDRRVCVRFTADEYDQALLAAEHQKIGYLSRNTLSVFIRQAVREKVRAWQQACDEKTASIAKAKAKGRKQLGIAGGLSDKPGQAQNV